MEGKMSKLSEKLLQADQVVALSLCAAFAVNGAVESSADALNTPKQTVTAPCDAKNAPALCSFVID
jgi:hypothetical protein